MRAHIAKSPPPAKRARGQQIYWGPISMTIDERTSRGNPGWENVASGGLLDDLAISFGINPALLPQRVSAVIVPNNKRLPNQTRDCNIFPQPTPEVLAALREGGLDVSLYDDGKEKRELVLKDANIILPTLVFFGSAAVSIGCSILSNLIYDRWIKPNPKRAPLVRAEYVEIDDNGTVLRWRRAEGNAEEVRQLLAQEATRPPDSKPYRDAQTRNLHEPAEDAQRRGPAQAALAEGAELVERAEIALQKKRRTTGEELFRQSLTKLREATLWEPDVSAHREYLHRTGLRVHHLFGCRIEFKKGEYSVSCPVMLSHTKGGFSIGGTATVVCSICGANVLECAHIGGRQYNRVTAARMGVLCNICGKRKCSHVEGRSYDGVERFGLVTDLDLDHISYVESPADPLCAVYSYNLPKADILKLLPQRERAEFVFGKTPLHCHHCTLCDGK